MQTGYADRKSFAVFQEYTSIKTHFNSDSYDYFKFGGKTKTSFDSFKTRRDTYHFYKLSKENDWNNMLLANIVNNKKVFIRTIVEQEGKDVYIDWKRKIDSLSYTFKLDLPKMDWAYKNNFLVVDGQHPLLMKLYLGKKISFETFTIMAHLAKVFSYWEENILDKYVASDIIRTSKRYKPFLEIDEKKFKKTIKEHFF